MAWHDADCFSQNFTKTFDNKNILKGKLMDEEQNQEGNNPKYKSLYILYTQKKEENYS